MANIDIKDFAKYIVYFFNSSGSLITNKKLQKLLYYTQAWHLVYFNDKLFNDEPEAWVHGAVYPNVYHQYKKFKAKPIVFDEGIDRKTLQDKLNSFNFSDDQKEFVNSVLIAYGKKEAFELEILNHREKPWLEAREGLEDYDISSKPISIDTMKTYYTELKKRSKNEL
jgi:uncharacterized phage-associated protein